MEAGKTTGKFASAIGKGLIAGLAGTAAMTIAQMVEQKITGRKQSNTPAKAATKVLPADEPEHPKDRQNLTMLTHFTYGTTWGIHHGLMRAAGLSPVAAASMHFSAVEGTAFAMLPGLDVAPPVNEWPRKQIAKDTLFHVIYAGVTALVYNAIDYEKPAEKEAGIKPSHAMVEHKGEALPEVEAF